MSFVWRNKEVEATLCTLLQMWLLGAMEAPGVVAALPILVTAVAGLVAMAGALALLPVAATPTTPDALRLLQMHLVDNLGPSAKFASKSAHVEVVSTLYCHCLHQIRSSSCLLSSRRPHDSIVTLVTRFLCTNQFT
jgi:hypothetical protein